MEKNPFYNILFTLSALIVTLTSLFAQSVTAPALGFNVFTENNLTLVTNESEGPVACGGDLVVGGNYQVSIHSVGTFSVSGVKIGLLVGGKVIYQSGEVKVNTNGYVKIGNNSGSTAWYYDQNNAASPIRVTPTSNYSASSKIMLQANSNQLNVGVNNNPVFEGNLIDFTGAFNTMRNTSANLSQCPHNVVIKNANGNVIPSTGLPNQIRVTLADGINVMNISGVDLNNIQVFNYDQQPSASKILIVNVNAPGTFNWNIGNQTGVGFQNCPYVLYNFYNTTSLSISGATLEGTVFAPFADVTKPGQSNIEGQLIAKSFQQSGGEMHYAIFTPSIPECTAVGGAAPVAGFSINEDTQCLTGNTFEFTNTSTGTDLSYSWDFGNNTTSTSANPTKTYSSAGTYNVRLIVKGANNLKDTLIKQITVQPATVGGSVSGASSVCRGSTSGLLTLSGHTGNVVRWESSIDNGATWQNITNTSTTYTSGALTQTTKFRAVLKSGNCNTVVSSYHIVTVKQPTSSTQNAVACNSYFFDGENLTASGTYTGTFTGVNGCDSIVTLNLTINSTVTNTVTATACNSYFFDGENLTTGGTYTGTFTGVNGCDSIVTLNLTINSTVTNTVTATACNSYFFDGENLTTGGTYTGTFTGVNGCDSIVTLNLTINSTVTNTVTATACNSYFFDGENLTASGTYTGTFTGANGCDSVVTLHLTMTEPTVAVVTYSTTSSDSVSITKRFVLENSSAYASWAWALTGTGTGLNPDSDTVEFVFTESGYFEVSVSTIEINGCDSTIVIPIIIESSEVGTGGNEGGLESESLGDAVSKRYVKRKMSSTPTVFVKSEAMLFYKEEAINRAYNKKSGQTLLQMFPSKLTDGNVAHITSPTDILDYTIAEEVLSVDFSESGKTKAVVLGVRTANKIYNHTKASCDRLKGAEIMTITKIQINGYNFLMQAIKQRKGNTEYAISFAVGKNKGEDNYSLQTNWYVNEYEVSNDVYNFQVWSTLPEYTIKLVKDILNNLNSNAAVQQTEVQKFPKTYAAKVSRIGRDLVLKLRSTATDQNIEMTLDEVYSETNGYAKRDLSVSSELEQIMKIDIKDGYEYDGLIKVEGEVQDAFYHADGNWGLDFDKTYTTIKEYMVYNDFERVVDPIEKQVHRNVKINAHSEYDYLTLYKSLLPGNLPDDYTDYGYLSFKAKGSGLLDVGMVKSSVQEWKHQYKTTINAKETERTYYIPFSHFKSTGTNQSIVADDLSMITFTFLPVEAGTNDLDLTIEDVKFTHTAPEGYEDLLSTMINEFIVYPNPVSNGNLNCILYNGEAATNATVSLRDITGKLLYTTLVSLEEGRNDLKFNFNTSYSGIMLLNISNSETDYGTSKIVLK